MSKIIIGIHGLANKPPGEELSDWWRKSLVEGLKNRGGQNPEFEFDMVYWADLLYKAPLHTDEMFSFDALYNNEPYATVKPSDLQEHRDSWQDNVHAKVLDVGGSLADIYRRKFGSGALTSWFLGKLLKDLAFYYDENRKLKNRSGQPEVARKVLEDELKNTLIAEKEKEIMLIAHSMGTIIAYNVLRDLGQSTAGVKVAHFVTIGSPLGLPYVKTEIEKERGYDPTVRTPSIVTQSWVNFADRKDPVALDIHLHDDYKKNKSGFRVKDDLIRNDYHTLDDKGDPKRNHHKSYGYLRAPELSDHVKGFLF